MIDLISQRLDEIERSPGWLIMQLGGIVKADLAAKFAGGKNRYRISLQEAVSIANALDCTIWDLFPELPKPKRK